MCKNKECGDPEGGTDAYCAGCSEAAYEEAFDRARARAWDQYEETGHW